MVWVWGLELIQACFPLWLLTDGPFQGHKPCLQTILPFPPEALRHPLAHRKVACGSPRRSHVAFGTRRYEKLKQRLGQQKKARVLQRPSRRAP